jgi:hypothetical protein
VQQLADQAEDGGVVLPGTVELAGQHPVAGACSNATPIGGGIEGDGDHVTIARVRLSSPACANLTR